MALAAECRETYDTAITNRAASLAPPGELPSYHNGEQSLSCQRAGNPQRTQGDTRGILSLIIGHPGANGQE
jgi:hypothetical protein